MFSSSSKIFHPDAKKPKSRDFKYLQLNTKMSSASTLSIDGNSEDGEMVAHNHYPTVILQCMLTLRQRLPIFDVGDEVFVEAREDATIGGPYLITEMEWETGGRISPVYFCKLKDEEGKVEECMPDTWLKAEPNWKEPHKRGDAWYGMRDARLHSQQLRDTMMFERSRGQGLEEPTLGTGTDAKESTAGRGQKRQVLNLGTNVEETAAGSSKKRPAPKIETKEKKKPTKGSK
ncbi:MAG: hypothetical protein ASARMPRED_001529 [Alectoria sarmentosa]|nr:MAG: hypothetical protein ASARMPRED_001529 [Alectoria sarmentosa]